MRVSTGVSSSSFIIKFPCHADSQHGTVQLDNSSCSSAVNGTVLSLLPRSVKLHLHGLDATQDSESDDQKIPFKEKTQGTYCGYKHVTFVVWSSN